MKKELLEIQKQICEEIERTQASGENATGLEMLNLFAMQAFIAAAGENKNA